MWHVYTVAECDKARIPRHRHRHPRRVSFSLPHELLQEIARVGRVGENPREDVRAGVGVGVVEFQLKQAKVVGLLLTTIGDGGYDQELSTADRRLSMALGVQLRSQRDGVNAARRAGPSAIAVSCHLSSATSV